MDMERAFYDEFVKWFDEQPAPTAKEIADTIYELKDTFDGEDDDLSTSLEMIIDDLGGKYSGVVDLDLSECEWYYSLHKDWEYCYGGRDETDYSIEAELPKCRVLTMAGGGDHWYNYVVTDKKAYIENKNGWDKLEHIYFSRCGNYVNVEGVNDEYHDSALDDGSLDYLSDY
jgi:hypothetical protein